MPPFSCISGSYTVRSISICLYLHIIPLYYKFGNSRIIGQAVNTPPSHFEQKTKGNNLVNVLTTSDNCLYRLFLHLCCSSQYRVQEYWLQIRSERLICKVYKVIKMISTFTSCNISDTLMHQQF